MPDATGIYQRIAPDGSISVNTAGVELKPRLPTEVPELTPNKQVRWVDDSAGLVAYVDDQYDPTNGNIFTLRSLSTLGRIVARAGNYQQNLLNADGTSDWLRGGNVKVYAQWGQANAWSANINNTVTLPRNLDRGDTGSYGGGMHLLITPTTDVWAIAIAGTLWTTPDAAWSSADWGMIFSPSLATATPPPGQAYGQPSSGGFDAARTYVTVHSALPPVGSAIHHIGAMNANTQYLIGMAVYGSTGYNQIYNQYYAYHRLFVFTIPRGPTYF